MTVKTTRKTKDPYGDQSYIIKTSYIIIKARDLIKLLARSVPFKQVYGNQTLGWCRQSRFSMMVFSVISSRLVAMSATKRDSSSVVSDCWVLMEIH